ncbi:endonuclease domain-containing protein [Streptosporangium sp. OZ121]|uniref:endonuclease domain-containing protein n=1 Tax=Streptosporangium sp. OZ121 TaxID=3444183 RepID=UPI003F7AE76B
MAGSWAELPIGRVVRVHGADADAIALSIDPLPDDTPAIVTYFAGDTRSMTEMVSSVLRELEKAAIGLFPAWLPGAEGIGGPGGAGRRAVRVLALRTASATEHFGPFLADLAERALRDAGTPARRTPREARAQRSPGFAAEVRAAGLGRVIAASFGRSRAAVLVHVPADLSPAAEESLVTGCEWLAHHGDLGVWLTGAPLTTVDRIAVTPLRLPAEVTDLVRDLPAPPMLRPDTRTGPMATYPPVAGRPHPASVAERTLETALAACDWAAGRAWNQTHRPHPLVNPIRVDLLWRDERCVIEIDGPEHHSALAYAADRQRDVRLQLDGYAVLRFTNAQVMTDTETVLHQIRRFLRGRRPGVLEGLEHAR